MLVHTVNNNAQFLLDKEYFEEVHRQLRALIAVHAVAEPDVPAMANAYVRIGMWVCHLDTIMPAIGGHAATTLQNLLEDLNDRAVKVEILLWAGSKVPNASAEQVTNAAVSRWGDPLPYVTVHLQPYANEWITRSSNHQKIFIINNAGVLNSFVGGFNLGSNYMSDTNHGQPSTNNWRANGRKWESNLWHDVAVCLTGPAALEVERIWTTNWNRAAAQPAIVAGGQGAPGAINVNLATTQRTSRSWLYFWSNDNYVTDIRDELVRHIGLANNYVYIENYALTSPAIIDALRAARVRGVKVIVVVHHPGNRLFFANEVWSFLMFFAYIGLTIPDADTISYRGWTGTYNLTDANYRFDVQQSANHHNPIKAIQDFYDLKMTYRRRINANENGTVRFRDISGLTTLAGRSPIMFAPRRSWDYGTADAPDVRTEYPYVHSKVAIIDDRIAFVGSSNWTFRSMVNDGEITAIIDNGAAVAAFRQNLWQHWGVNAVNPLHWPDAPLAPANGQVRMQALNFGSFIQPRSRQAYTTISSWLGWYAPNLF